MGFFDGIVGGVGDAIKNIQDKTSLSMNAFFMLLDTFILLGAYIWAGTDSAISDSMEVRDGFDHRNHGTVFSYSAKYWVTFGLATKWLGHLLQLITDVTAGSYHSVGGGGDDGAMDRLANIWRGLTRGMANGVSTFVTLNALGYSDVWGLFMSVVVINWLSMAEHANEAASDQEKHFVSDWTGRRARVGNFIMQHVSLFYLIAFMIYVLKRNVADNKPCYYDTYTYALAATWFTYNGLRLLWQYGIIVLADAASGAYHAALYFFDTVYNGLMIYLLLALLKEVNFECYK